MNSKSNPFLRYSLALAAFSTFLSMGAAHAVTYNWDGDTSSDFTTPSNWVEDAWTQWENYRFGSAVTNGTVNLNLNGLDEYGMGSLTLESGLTQDIVIGSAGGSRLIMGTDQSSSSALITIAADSRDLTINAQYVASTAVTWDIGDGRTLTMAGQLNDWYNPASLVKNGAGTAVLTNSNGYTGTTTISGGTLNLQGAGGAGTNYNGGNININGVSTLRVTGQRYNFAGETFTFDNVGGGTIDAIASGAGGFVFTGNNTFATSGGAQNIISGTKNGAENQGFNLDGQTAIFNVVTGSDATSDLKVTGTIWNGGNVTKDGAGRLEISAPQQYLGTTTVNSGTLILGDGTNNIGLSNLHDLVVASGTTLQLNYAVGNTDSIDELWLGGVQQNIGTYGAGTYSGVTITGTGTLKVLTGPPIADPFLAWIDSFFPGETDPLIIGATADPDNDGIENLVEYVLKNGDPDASTTGILPTLNATGANFVFTYLRRTDATGTTQTFQYGSNLIGWMDVPVTNGGIVSITSPEDGIQQVVITVAKGTNTKLFGRLQVVK